MKPITPTEAEYKRIEKIDPEIIQAVNELIVENLVDGESTFKQEEIIERYFKIKKKPKTTKSRGDLFDRNQFTFKKIFEEAGWSVKFERPDYTESFPSYYTFEKKKKPRVINS